jgi:hypothetical protein
VTWLRDLVWTITCSWMLDNLLDGLTCAYLRVTAVSL